jgi:thiol-disulfide isomerase/thioredoxin
MCYRAPTMPHTHAIPTALFCAILFAACAAFAGAQDSEPAPRFNARTVTGEKFTNESIKGKIVLLDFWTTWCSFCAAEAGLVDKLNHDYADKGLLVLAVNVGESKKTVNRYLAQHPRTSRVVLTDDTNLAAMYQATVYPIYVVIDRDGNVAATQRGAAGDEALHRLLARAGLRIPTASDSE